MEAAARPARIPAVALIEQKLSGVRAPVTTRERSPAGPPLQIKPNSFVLADLAASARRKAQGKTPVVISPIALEAVRRIAELYLEAWMRHERARLSRHNDVAQAMESPPR